MNTKTDGGGARLLYAATVASGMTYALSEARNIDRPTEAHRNNIWVKSTRTQRLNIELSLVSTLWAYCLWKITSYSCCLNAPATRRLKHSIDYYKIILFLFFKHANTTKKLS